MPTTISVSIINYRTGDLTIACVQSVLDAARDETALDIRTIVVDNASGDGSPEQIASWIAEQDLGDRVELVLSPTNTGFAGGHNQGITACDSDFVLVLNSDAAVRPGAFSALMRAAETAPDAGFLAPRLEDPDGTAQVSCFRAHSPWSELSRAAVTGFVTRFLGRHEVALGTDPAPHDIEWMSFACILLRREMINAIGLMDDGYFLYFEDAEYALRGRRAGWGCAYVPEARVIHYRGGSGPVKALQKARKRLPRYYYCARSRFFHQQYGHAGLLAANLCWHLGRGIAQLRRLAGKSPVPMAEHEARDIWINFTNPLGPRGAPGE